GDELRGRGNRLEAHSTGARIDRAHAEVEQHAAHAPFGGRRRESLLVPDAACVGSCGAGRRLNAGPEENIVGNEENSRAHGRPPSPLRLDIPGGACKIEAGSAWLETEDRLRLVGTQALFVGMKLDSQLRRRLETIPETEKKYVSRDNTTFLTICRLGEE